MLRYIKVNNKWIDTLVEQRDNHITYLVIEGKVINVDTDEILGKLQEEKDHE